MFGIKTLEREVHRLGGTATDPTDHPLLSFFVSTTCKLLGTERCSIFILDTATKRVWLKRGTGVGDRAIEVQIEGSIVGQVIATGEPVIENDMAHRSGAHRQVEQDIGFVTRNMVCVPIRGADGSAVLGAVQVLNKHQGDFTQADAAELGELARYLQMTIDAIYHNQEMVGTMAKVVRLGQAVIVAIALAVVAITALMVLYVFTAVAMGG